LTEQSSQKQSRWEWITTASSTLPAVLRTQTSRNSKFFILVHIKACFAIVFLSFTSKDEIRLLSKKKKHGSMKLINEEYFVAISATESLR
jgi:hypothetical protein